MKQTKMPKVVRTSSGLRHALFDELDALRAGSSTPHKANATANIASGIIDLVRAEIDVKRLVGDTNTLTSIGHSIDLG
tara:strand:+ start:147 stop:380 length:234 start_codon:yes stop_codon:yes gene_type:complete